jgi:uncharacterized damage-inducible protein DinB
VTTEKWFERSFDLTLPAGRFPGIVERLRGTPARIDERLASVPAAVLTRRDADHWSIQENIGHLLDLEPLWLRRLEQLFAGETELAPTDLANRRTFDAGHNDRPLSELLREFRAARAKLVERFEAADDATVMRSALHPRLRSPMRTIDLAFFVAEHDDHHLATITGLLAPPPAR